MIYYMYDSHCVYMSMLSLITYYELKYKLYL